MKHYSSDSLQSQQLMKHPEYHQLLAPFFKPITKELQEWAEAEYVHNEYFMDQLIHKTYSGIMVRSKSEVMIDMLLFRNKIPFRYECALEIGDTLIYPDFTIRHPKSGEIFYWEHFGLMDKPDYCLHTISKLQLYTSHDIIPSINLITTYETQQHPLEIREIENIIQYYFLA